MPYTDPLETLAAHAAGRDDAPLWGAVGAALREIRDREDRAALERLVVLDTEQAVRLANQRSVSAYRRWARDWKVRASGHDRWSGRAIRAGLEREADSALHHRAKATAKKNQAKENTP